MAFLPYCRMEETYDALKDVYNNWNKPTSPKEYAYKYEILDLCKRIAQAYDPEQLIGSRKRQQEALPRSDDFAVLKLQLFDALKYTKGRLTEEEKAEALQLLNN